MKNPQEIFNSINEKKKKAKELNKSFRDALDSSAEYQKITEELKSFRDKQKEIKSNIMSDFQKDLEKFDDLKADIDSDKILLTDIAMSHYVNGKEINIEDEYGNKYEPEFSINFRKM